MDLDADKQEFVEAVMLPLGADDVRRDLLVRSVLMAGRMDVLSRGDPAGVAAGRMRETAARFRVKQHLVVWGMVSLAAAVLWVFFLSPAAFRSTQMLLGTAQGVPLPKIVGRLYLGDDAKRLFQERMKEGISASRLQMAMGDFHQKPAARWKVVRDAYPEDPAHYFAYAQAVFWEEREWPADMVETGERLAPENGWFRLLRVGSRMEEAVIPAPNPRLGKRKVPGIVKDEQVLQELLAELDLVTAKAELDDYRPRLKALRLDAWPPPLDFPEYVLSVNFSYEHPEDREFGFRESRNLGDIISTAANSSALKGDKETLDRVASRFLGILNALASSPKMSLLQYYSAAYISSYGGRSISDAYATLGETKRAADYTRFADQTDTKINKGPVSPPDALEGGYGSSFAQLLAFKYSPHSKPVSDVELRGGRFSEYSMMERLLVLLEVGVFVVIFLFFILVPLKDRKECGLLGSRLAALLRWNDRCWIFLVGFLLPLAVYVSARSYSWHLPGRFMSNSDSFNSMLMQGAGLILSIVLGVLQAARWRLSRRGSVLGLGWRGFDPGWIFYVLAMILIPLSPLVRRLCESLSLDEDWSEASGWSLLGPPFLWLLAMGYYHFAGSPDRRLHRLVLIHGAAPFIAGAVLLSAAGVTILHAEERKWTGRIDFEAITPDRPAFESRLDKEYVAWRRSEMLRALREMD